MARAGRGGVDNVAIVADAPSEHVFGKKPDLVVTGLVMFIPTVGAGGGAILGLATGDDHWSVVIDGRLAAAPAIWMLGGGGVGRYHVRAGSSPFIGVGGGFDHVTGTSTNWLITARGELGYELRGATDNQKASPSTPESTPPPRASRSTARASNFATDALVGKERDRRSRPQTQTKPERGCSRATRRDISGRPVAFCTDKPHGVRANA
jgi:hypothetical protein